MLRLVVGLAVFALYTPLASLVVATAGLLGVRDRWNGIYDRASRSWARALLGATGVTVRVHGEEHVAGSGGQIFVANHVSWFDVFALAARLPHYKFVAKAELRRIPIFGWGATKWGIIWIERENRASAFGAYESAAKRIAAGTPVVVFPEGTRGESYALRPFKKGPFVLAIASQVPIVPTVIHGTIEVQSRRSMKVTPGEVHVHFLEPIPTAGLTYEDRDLLAARVHARMAEAMERLYGVKSPALPGGRGQLEAAVN